MRYDDYTNRYTPVDINEMFKTKPLNSHLITPSLEFSYSLCIEYMKEWFLKRFNKDFFGKDRAYVYVDGSHVFSEFNKLNKEQLLSRAEPNKGALAIVATINDDFNREGIEDTMFGTDILVRRARHDDSFFKDKAHDRYASAQLTLINMNFTYKVRVETLAQQMDLFARMKQTFRVGYTWGEYIAMDYLIPMELILSMAIDAGFEVENGDVKNPIQFLNYINTYSLWPILYKHRGVNGLNEYFIRIPNMYVWINAKDISRDTGERIGHLNTRYNIEMNCEVRFPSAQYYVYHNTTRELSFKPSEIDSFNEAAFENVNAMRLFYIPQVNDKGWNSYLYTAYEDSYIHNAFENAAATMSGVETAYRALKKKGKIKENYKFITFGGDGGTYDIGIQSLSGAMERGHDFTYVCYDNGAYMNTGIQRSSATPMYADTTTTPVGSMSNGKPQYRKDLTQILAAHNIPYAAQTTFIQNFKDLHIKSERAIYTEGPAFLNIMAPCPRGWRYDAADIMQICKMAVETCYWPLFEIIDGKWILSYTPKKKLPIEEFLKTQGRFKHLFKKENEHLIELYQQEVDSRWESLLERCAD